MNKIKLVLLVPIFLLSHLMSAQETCVFNNSIEFQPDIQREAGRSIINLNGEGYAVESWWWSVEELELLIDSGGL